jgi:hypothetical protein
LLFYVHVPGMKRITPSPHLPRLSLKGDKGRQTSKGCQRLRRAILDSHRAGSDSRFAGFGRPQDRTAAKNASATRAKASRAGLGGPDPRFMRASQKPHGQSF